MSVRVRDYAGMCGPGWRVFGGSPMAKKRFAELLGAKGLAVLPSRWHADGRGLYLVVTSNGSRRWVLRVMVKGGRRRELGLGSLCDVPIESARDKAAQLRRAARLGRDPIVERRAAAAASVTFKHAFDKYFAVKRRSLRNAKHIAQWISTIETYVFPRLAQRAVSEITSGEVLAVLEPIWHAKPETAKRVLQRMCNVFDAAILYNWRERASPCIGVTQALGGTGHRAVRHHLALPYDRVCWFVGELRACGARAETKLALEWLILTATRSSETRFARWGEVDEGRALWTIPAERMKWKRQHHEVPLAPRCLEILAEARALGSKGEFLFQNRSTGRPLSDMTFTKLLRDLGLHKIATAHGFRSSFRDWASEVDKTREVVAEAALGHSVRNKTEAAYRRATYLGERAGLMNRWCAYLNGATNTHEALTCREAQEERLAEWRAS